MDQDLTNCSILWRRLDLPGYESARLFSEADHWSLRGTAVFSYEGLPCRLDYQVVCDSDWLTRSTRVEGWVGNNLVNAEIQVSPEQTWLKNGVVCPQLKGCLDVDLNFSPSTNLLPIRRLNLAVGEEMEVTAAWLRFPNFELEPLVQLYRRSGENSYRYESGGGAFVSQISVNAAGLVTEYPNLWKAEAEKIGVN